VGGKRKKQLKGPALAAGGIEVRAKPRGTGVELTSGGKGKKKRGSKRGG